MRFAQHSYGAPKNSVGWIELWTVPEMRLPPTQNFLKPMISGDGGILVTMVKDVSGLLSVSVYDKNSSDTYDLRVSLMPLVPYRRYTEFALSFQGHIMVASTANGFDTFTSTATNLEWTTLGYVSSGDASGGSTSISISGDGERIAVGYPFDDPVDDYAEGAAAIFDNNFSAEHIVTIFGDPHYVLLSGSLVTCNDLGAQIVLDTWNWTIIANHAMFDSNPDATVIDSVEILFKSPLAPIQNIVINASNAGSSFIVNAGTAFQVNVGNNYVALTDNQLELFVHVFLSNWLNIGVLLGSEVVVVFGILLNGCDTQANTASAPATEACAAFAEPYRTACDYDMAQT